MDLMQLGWSSLWCKLGVESEELDGAWQTDEASLLAEQTNDKLHGRVQNGPRVVGCFEYNIKLTPLAASTLEYV